MVVSNIFLCSSLFGEDSHFDKHIFKKGLVQPPTRIGERLCSNFDIIVVKESFFSSNGAVRSLTAWLYIFFGKKVVPFFFTL